mmetsp:Transcript_28797/g.77507  ORF Transcript_28797/g.77507 Transcript_28797/m.77507 type:complete len:413 (+) Transcript_28797:42-1280(+)
MGFTARVRERWRARQERKGGEPQTPQSEGPSTGRVEDDMPLEIVSAPSAPHGNGIGQRIYMFFEELAAGISRSVSDISAWIGITSPTGGDPDEAESVMVQEEIKPDPLPVLPEFGNLPRTPEPARNMDNTCSLVDTYFLVRDKNYLKDRIKSRSQPRIFEFIGCDVLRGPVSARDICAHPDGIMNSPEYQAMYRAAHKASLSQKRKSFRRPTAANGDVNGATSPAAQAPFIFAVNFALPAAPSLAPNQYVNFVCYYGRVGRSDNETFEKLWDRFCQMTPAQRSARLKLIPVMVNGPQAFQKSVANRPAIIGNKLKATWYESKNHMEVIVDVGTSYIATQMWKLMLPQAKNLAMDIAWVIEGQATDELPENVLGACHLSKPDLNKTRTIIPQTRNHSGTIFSSNHTSGSERKV